MKRTNTQDSIETLPPGEKRSQLLDWLESDVPVFFKGRILDIDVAVAHPGTGGHQSMGILRAGLNRHLSFRHPPATVVMVGFAPAQPTLRG